MLLGSTLVASATLSKSTLPARLAYLVNHENAHRPKTRCFIGDVDYATFARNTILSRSFDVASNLSIDRARQALVKQQIEVDALYQTQLEVCAEIMGEKLRYAGTSTVVRDIDYITTELEGSDALMQVSILLCLFAPANVVPLCSNFYGFSYGTIMGQYLVNMCETSSSQYIAQIAYCI